jgi:DNA anti-recombination protein RmuC
MYQQLILTLALIACVAWPRLAMAVEVAPRITDREIIEALAALRSGQRHLQDQLKQLAERLTDTRKESQAQLADVRKGLEAQLANTRKELKAQLADVRKGLEAQLADVRKGLEAQLANTRKESQAQLADVRKGLEAQIINVRKELQAQIINTRKELKDFMLWGFGVTFAGMFALIGFVIWDRRSALAPAVTRIRMLEERDERMERRPAGSQRG